MPRWSTARCDVVVSDVVDRAVPFLRELEARMTELHRHLDEAMDRPVQQPGAEAHLDAGAGRERARVAAPTGAHAAASGMSLPPPLPPEGWYDDPTHPGHPRWWNGAAWGNPAPSWEGNILPELRRPPPREGAVACTHCAMPIQHARPTGERMAMVNCPRCGLSDNAPVGKAWACARCAAPLLWGTCVGCDAQVEVWLPGAHWRCSRCLRWNWSTWASLVSCTQCGRQQRLPGFPGTHRCVSPRCGASVRRLMCLKCGTPTIVWVRGKPLGKWRCQSCRSKNVLPVPEAWFGT